MKVFYFGLLTALMMGCGAESNPLGFMILPQSQESVDSLTYDAEAAMDAGDYELAIEIATRANKLDPGSEHLAVVLGYAYLASAGIDPFSLAEKLMEQGDNKTESNEGETGATSEASSSANPLEPLRSLLGLDASELSAITLDGNQTVTEDGTVIKGAPSDGLFKDYPVLLPKTASEARLAGGEALTNLAKAIKAICPFVSESAKVLSPVEDPRHGREACPPSEKERYFSGKAHYIWAFAHLTEAIAFNAVVLYDPTGEGANIIRRSDAISDPAAVPLNQYISSVNELAVTMEIILPTSEDKTADSMLMGMVNDLQATSKGFDNLPGMPESMTKSIKDAITKLEEQKAQMQTSGISEQAASSSALKESLTEALSDNLKTQIEQRSSDGSFTQEEKESVCASYASISSEALAACEGV